MQSKAPVTTGETRVTSNETPVSNTDTAVTQPKASVTQSQSLAAQQTDAPQSQTSGDVRPGTQPSASEIQQSNAGAHNQANLAEAQPKIQVTPHWNDVGDFQSPEFDPPAATAQSTEASETNPLLSAREAHLLATEMPNTSASSEILLHLTGDDQSLAAIRVADRAGLVDVSVHASDPVLRESLRSNLGELSTQLNSQGWKADVIQTATVAAHSENQQDGSAGGQRSFSQHQSSGGDRQTQRDRRGNGGQWQQEFDQQFSGGDAHSGGNG